MKKDRRYIIVATCIIALTLFAGCSSAKTEEVKEKPTATVQEENNTEEATVEVGTEAVTQNVEAATYEKAITWAKKVKEEEPKLTIWNSITKQGLVLENAKKYIVKEGDVLVLCGNFEGAVYTDIDVPVLNKVLSTSIHKEYEFTEIPAGETEINIFLKVNEKEYELSLTIVPENATSTVSDSEIIQTTELSGEAWASTLEYEEPKLVVWNDETGTKEVIELGGKYVMQEGDTIGIYCPIGYGLFNVFPIDVATSTIVVSDVVVIEFNLPSESQEINLEAEILNPQDEFVRYNYVITTP